MTFYFNSRDPRCKTPFGAVAAGTRVEFNIIARGLSASTVLETFSFTDGARESFPALTTEHGLTFSVVFARPDVVFYRFFLGDGRYIGAAGDYSGEGEQSDGTRMFSQTVYDPDYETPRDFRGGMLYQIFPDSFCCSGSEKKDVPPERIMLSTDATPDWRPDSAGRYSNRYYGGDLRGITEKLDYLSELGVTALYLNPIFEAHSNHRYNTADYLKIDPLLGDEADFAELCRVAAEKGIRVILDGVFSHTGDDSVYFNRFGRYGDGGASRSRSSEYFKWYKFERYPNKVHCWWGIPTLPETCENEPSFADFICGSNGVIAHWLKLGASGFRLDVADELPDAFIEKLRVAVKAAGDNLLIGEVWEDATTKISYGEKRRYLLGGELDSVMNYPLRTAILDFLRTADAITFKNAVMSQLENYPPQSACCLMNLLSTHDTERAITLLAGVPQPPDRAQAAVFKLSHDEYLRGVELMKLAFVLLFTSVGIPCVYYGDEIGMQGFGDPFCRAYYSWNGGEESLRSHVAALGALRKREPLFAGPDLEFIYAFDGCVAFVRRGQGRAALVAVNRGEAVAELEFEGRRYTVEPWRYLIEIV